MTRAEAEDHVGASVELNGDGNLAMFSELRRFIGTGAIGALLHVTSAGMCHVRFDGRRYAVPPRNVDRVVAT